MTSQQGSPRILITRLSAVGDCIMTLPLLTALRRNLPQAFLAWAAEPGPASLLEGHPHLDELIVVPKDWLGAPRRILAMRRRLRALRFDAVVDPQSLSKSCLLGWLSGARRRVGFAPPRGRELAVWCNNVRYPAERPHAVDHQLDLLAAWGIEDRRVEFHLPENPAADATISDFLRRDLPGEEFAVVNPGAGWNSKLWLPERFGQVARYLGARCGLVSVVTWCGQEERAWAERITESAGGHAVTAPPTSLPELAALLRRARLYVGSDTGPTHLAAAVGTRCVALFATTQPEVTGPYGAGHRFLQARGPVQDQRHRRRASNEAMRTIPIEDVCEACRELLDELAGTGSGCAA